MPWKISQFPELDHLDPDQRATLLRRVPWWTYPMLSLRAAMGGVTATTAILWIILQVTGTSFSPFTLTLLALLAVSAGIYIYLAELNTLRTTMRAEIAKAFTGRRPPFCFACGYDLRACDAPRCPECGKPTGEIAEAD